MKNLIWPLVVLFIAFNITAKAQCISGNCTDGIGTYLWDSGDEYTGEWNNGSRTGIGVYDWKDGSYYYGYFKDGKLDGKGVYIGNDDAKTTLIGYFRDGSLKEKDNFVETGCIIGNCDNGIGVYLWESDDVYIGEWKYGNRTGYGRYDWKDGSFYTGYFKEGKLDTAVTMKAMRIRSWMVISKITVSSEVPMIKLHRVHPSRLPPSRVVQRRRIVILS